MHRLMYGMQLLLCSARSGAPTGDLSAIYTHNSIIGGPEAAKQLLAVQLYAGRQG